MPKAKKTSRKRNTKSSHRKVSKAKKSLQHKHARKVIQHAVAVKRLVVPSVRAVVSKIRSVRKAHHASLKKMKKLHKSFKKAAASRHVKVRHQIAHMTKASKTGLNTFFYELGATISSSRKAIFAPQKTGK